MWLQEHRVTLPTEEKRRKSSRRVNTLFVQPDDNVTVQPLDGSDAFPQVNAYQYVMNRIDGTYVY